MFIRRKKKKGDAEGLPSWIVSYGDLVTTLLCFFIILSTLAKDQTGMRLYAGLESFRNRPVFPEVFGSSKRSSNMVLLDVPASSKIPKSLMESPQKQAEKKRLMDLELADFQRFLGEMQRQFEVQKSSVTWKTVTFDIFEPLSQPSLTPGPQATKKITEMMRLVLQGNYQLTIMVWATMPSKSAWIRAGNQANSVAGHVITQWNLTPQDQKRILPQGRVWRYRDSPRPVLSLVLARVK